MIKFALVCANEHEFESWFQSDAAFEVQTIAGLISCPVCRETGVTKAIMSPAIAAIGRGLDRGAGAKRSDAPGAPILDARDKETRTMIHEMRRRIFEQAEDVGGSFPDEARKISQGLVSERPICGYASFDEARDLLEEGIAIFPIPALPDELN
jgi:hypothetical protein